MSKKTRYCYFVLFLCFATIFGSDQRNKTGFFSQSRSSASAALEAAATASRKQVMALRPVNGRRVITCHDEARGERFLGCLTTTHPHFRRRRRRVLLVPLVRCFRDLLEIGAGIVPISCRPKKLPTMTAVRSLPFLGPQLVVCCRVKCGSV